jgi:hypothetical protein
VLLNLESRKRVAEEQEAFPGPIPGRDSMGHFLMVLRLHEIS